MFSGASELRPRCPKIMRSPSDTSPSLSEVDDMAGMLHERRQPSGIAGIREQGQEHVGKIHDAKGHTRGGSCPSVVIVLFECVSVAECGLGMLVCCVEEE